MKILILLWLGAILLMLISVVAPFFIQCFIMMVSDIIDEFIKMITKDKS